MGLRNCAECGKVFVFVSRNICPACLELEEKMFDKVRDFLKENPGAKITEVSEATDVPEEKIIRFLKEGKIVSSNLTSDLVCENCGASISSGRYCEKCNNNLRKQIQSITKTNIRTEIKSSSSISKGMHYKKD